MKTANASSILTSLNQHRKKLIHDATRAQKKLTAFNAKLARMISDAPSAVAKTGRRVDESVKAKIRQARKDGEMTIKEIAKKFGVSTASVQNWTKAPKKESAKAS